MINYLTAIKNKAGEMCLQMENPYGQVEPPSNWTRGDAAVMAGAEEQRQIQNMQMDYYQWHDFARNNPPIQISGFELSEGDKVEEGEVELVEQMFAFGQWSTCSHKHMGTRVAYIRIPAK